MIKRIIVSRLLTRRLHAQFLLVDIQFRLDFQCSTLRRLTVCVTGGWGEQSSEMENCYSSEQAPKTRRVPAVRCTLC